MAYSSITAIPHELFDQTRIGSRPAFGSRHAPGIEFNHAAIGGYPQRSISCLNNVIHPGMREPIGNRISRKFAPIEPCQPAICSEPEKASRILSDSVDVIVSEAIGSCISPDRKLLAKH